MLVLGPKVIKDGLTPDTALVPCRGIALLGPVDPTPEDLDPIARIFVILGKIMAIRRVVMPDSPTAPQECIITELEGVQMAAIDQATDGSAEDFGPWEVVYDPLSKSIEQDIVELKDMKTMASQAVTRLFDLESARILGLSPNLPIEAKVQAVVDYMNVNALFVEAQTDGMRDYLMRVFTDAESIPVAFPSSIYPSFPDSWITPDVITPVNPGRTWLIIL